MHFLLDPGAVTQLMAAGALKPIDVVVQDFGRVSVKTLADVAAADDEVVAVGSPPLDQDVDVGLSVFQ